MSRLDLILFNIEYSAKIGAVALLLAVTVDWVMQSA